MGKRVGAFDNKKLPTLDLQIWITKDGFVEFEFYEKPMAANTVLDARTALSDNTKYSSLSQEVVRRLMHTSRRLEASRRVEKLEELSQKMANSSHSMKFIRDILISGIKSYTAKVMNSLLYNNNSL